MENGNDFMKAKKAQYRIVRASKPELNVKELGTACDILNRCTQKLIKDGHTYWDITYLMEKFKSMTNDGDIRVLYDGSTPIATFTLLDMPPEEVREVWGEQVPCTYLRAFAVIPERQREGIGKLLLRGVERIVENEKKKDIIRFHAAHVLKDYFQGKRGYEIFDEIINLGEKYDLVLFEKRLK